MYHHILVPLDGSELAEQVLPHVKMLASLEQNATVTLLRAVFPIYPITTEYSGVLPAAIDELAASQDEAQMYLDDKASMLFSEGYNVEVVISNLPAAEAIIDYTEKHQVNLIAIATHGRSGLSRWVFGSVTQKVIQATHVPLLVVHPTE